MGDYNNRGRSGGPRRSFDSRGSDRPQMHRATCSNCGKECEVPFRPNGSKPVLCSDCFKNGGGPERRNDRNERNDSRNFSRPNSEDRQMFNAVCSNCGNDCQIPFQPRDGRPVFCSRCFEKNDTRNESRDEPQRNAAPQQSYKADFAALNAKLDTILSLLQQTSAQPAEALPLESLIDESVIDEIAEEIEEQKAVKAVKEVKPKVKKVAKAKKTAKK